MDIPTFGKLRFDSWENLELAGGWCDAFIFRIHIADGLPPNEYAAVVRSVVNPLRSIRPAAAIWVQVEQKPRLHPGQVPKKKPELQEKLEARSRAVWFCNELRYALRKASVPVAVTMLGNRPSTWDFNYTPQILPHPAAQPPSGDPYLQPGDLRSSELTCLRVLTRANCASTLEVASMANLSRSWTREALRSLAARRLVRLEKRGRFPFWIIQRPGISRALRSWGHPPGLFIRRPRERGRDACRERAPDRRPSPAVEIIQKPITFRGRKGRKDFLARERLRADGRPHRIRSGRHRRTARLWPAWLRAAWPQAAVWAGWTEVPCGRGRPDGLCWGWLMGYESLFWLEVESGSASRRKILERTVWRINTALVFARRSRVRLVFVMLARPWVLEAVLKISGQLPADLALVLADWMAFGELPPPNWGQISRDRRLRDRWDRWRR